MEPAEICLVDAQAASDAVEKSLPRRQPSTGGDAGAQEQHEIAATSVVGETASGENEIVAPRAEIPQGGVVAGIGVLELSARTRCAAE